MSREVTVVLRQALETRPSLELVALQVSCADGQLPSVFDEAIRTYGRRVVYQAVFSLAEDILLTRTKAPT